MKSLLFTLFVLLTLSVAKATDIIDAQAAFATLLEYQKTDDARSPDLFSPDCNIVFTLSDGKATKSTVIPPAAFHEMLIKQLALKQGNKDTYEDVKYAQENASVRVTATVLYADTGKRAPFSMLYSRDAANTLKIKEMKVTLPVDALPPQ